MQKDSSEIYYSKIMLFGEYTIIKGSMGLTIPYAHFNGQLAFPNKNSYTDLAFAQRSNQHLYEFWYYLQSLANNGELESPFDTEKLKNDLDEGLYFESSIPEGYGIGSSGALVAALYSRYVSKFPVSAFEMGPKEIRTLKEQMAKLESWFHGTSSGIDPLICYMKHPLLLKDLEHIEPVGLPHYNDHGDDAIFLINSGKPGRTAPLVDGFIDQYTNNQKYRDMVDNDLTPISNACITSLINNDQTGFYSNLERLSALQKENLSKMVPNSATHLWENGLRSKDYFLKLCGSGGGGFVLGFTRNYAKTKKIMYDNKIDTIPVYHDIRE